MSRILLVEDFPETQKLVSLLLRDNEVLVAGSLAEARKLLSEHTFDLLLLDVMLPDGDGFEFSATLKVNQKTQDLPIIFLTGKSETSEKLLGFSLGAEDYITKPFDSLEFKARVECRLAKIHRAKGHEDLINLDDLQIDLNLQRILVKVISQWTKIDLTFLEFKLLAYFGHRVDHVLSRDQLISAVWSEGTYLFDRTIDSHICKLRKKIGSSSWQIKSVYGAGYCFQKKMQTLRCPDMVASLDKY